MSASDFLEYKPSFKRDEREKTAFIDEEPLTTEMEGEGELSDSQTPVSDLIDQYDQFKEDLNNKVDSLEGELEYVKLPDDEYVYKALEELGFTSNFTPRDFRDIFKEKESSAGKYLTNVLEKTVESEIGSIEWEMFIEYLELLEEVNVLDYYIESILYPLFEFSEDVVDNIDVLKELERNWNIQHTRYKKKEKETNQDYRKSLYTDPKQIPIMRDKLHSIEEEGLKLRQAKNQIDTSYLLINNKIYHMNNSLKEIEGILEDSIDEDILNDDILRLSESDDEAKHVLRNNILMLKQTIDHQNKEKEKLKESRRLIYSEEKQKKIIGEYASTNKLYRESVLQSIHYMKSFQDKTTSVLDEAFNASANSLWENHQDNRDKTFESYLIQISTSQMRDERLGYVSSKQKSRLVFNKLMNIYEEMN